MAIKENVVAVVKRDRSPAYPFISLKTAIERLVAFEAYFGRHPGPLAKVGVAWDMKAGSSQAGQTISAMKYFGLVEYQGSTEQRSAALSEDAKTFLRAQQEQVKQDVLKRCALRPKAISKYWEKWGPDRPKDPIALDELVLQGSFTENAAKTFLQVYDDTIDYAKLVAGDKGRALDQDGNDDEDDPETIDDKPPKHTGIKMRQDTFTLDEGTVSLNWPEKLSKASYDDLKDWLEIMARKLERAVTNDDKKEPDA